jgi:hypothetical protein
MTGVIRARRMADENTATLAEYYKSNPLLEGLSVPRVRIAELTIDLPVLIDEEQAGESAVMETPAKIAAAVETQLKSSMLKNEINITKSSVFHKAFATEVKGQITALNKLDHPVMKETVARAVQNAFIKTLDKKGVALSDSQKTLIASDLRDRVVAISITKGPVHASILSNIKTADVKEQSTPSSIVRLKITLKEEGLEWTTQVNADGTKVNTLTPE